MGIGLPFCGENSLGCAWELIVQCGWRLPGRAWLRISASGLSLSASFPFLLCAGICPRCGGYCQGESDREQPLPTVRSWGAVAVSGGHPPAWGLLGGGLRNGLRGGEGSVADPESSPCRTLCTEGPMESGACCGAQGSGSHGRVLNRRGCGGRNLEAVAGVTWEWPGWGAVTIGIIWTELDWPLVSKPASPWRPCAGEQGVEWWESSGAQKWGSQDLPSLCRCSEHTPSSGDT